MKVAVIADIHDNLTNLQQCLEYCRENNISKMICCGDVTNGETLKYLADNFNGEIMLVKGNMEIYEESEIERYENLNYGGRVGRFQVDDKTIGACHEPYLVDKVLERKDCHIVFYGHTHRPWEEVRNGVRLINPGTLGGVFSRPTYAVWNTETDEMEMELI
ncbi:MAG: metallophosphoesterase family protein [Patescibacteria group bacterium]